MPTTIYGSTGIDQVQDGVITSAKLDSSVKPLGVDQTLQDLTASRAMNTTYTNSTGRLIVVTGYLTCTTAQKFQCLIDGIVITFESSVISGVTPFVLMIPSGSTYLINPGGLNFTLTKWWELR